MRGSDLAKILTILSLKGGSRSLDFWVGYDWDLFVLNGPPIEFFTLDQVNELKGLGCKWDGSKGYWFLSGGVEYAQRRG